MYNCYTHGWSSHHSMCPACFTDKTATSTDTLPPETFTAQLYSHYECQAKYEALEKKCARYREALESAASCFSCIRHNCKPDMFLLALDVSSQITMKHIDASEHLARQALADEVKDEA